MSCIINWIETHSGTIQALSGIVTAFLAWATLRNRRSLDQLIEANEINQKNLTQMVQQNDLYREEIMIQRKKTYKAINTFLTGGFHDPIRETIRFIRVKNIGANAINFKYANQSSSKFTINIGHNVISANTEQDIEMRADKLEDMDDLYFDFVYSGINGLEVTQRFYKINGFPGVIFPPQEYIDKFGFDNPTFSKIKKAAYDRNIDKT